MPWAPVAPTAPEIPDAPVAPIAPDMPCGPEGPDGPGMPADFLISIEDLLPNPVLSLLSSSSRTLLTPS